MLTGRASVLGVVLWLAALLPSSDAIADGRGWPDDSTKAAPCRPTVSCTADLASPGAFELEAGALASVAAGDHRQLSFPFLLKQTIGRSFQLQAGSNGYTVLRGDASGSYFDNAFFGPKLHLLDQGEGWPSLAISALVSVPVFRSTVFGRHDDAQVVGHLGKDAGSIHVDWNLGLVAWHLDDAPVAQAFAAAAMSTSLPPPFGIALEGYVFSDAAPAAPRDGGLRFALTATPRPWLVLDFGGDTGFFPSTHAYAFFFGMTVVPFVSL